MELEPLASMEDCLSRARDVWNRQGRPEMWLFTEVGGPAWHVERDPSCEQLVGRSVLTTPTIDGRWEDRVRDLVPNLVEHVRIIETRLKHHTGPQFVPPRLVCKVRIAPTGRLGWTSYDSLNVANEDCFEASRKRMTAQWEQLRHVIERWEISMCELSRSDQLFPRALDVLTRMQVYKHEFTYGRAEQKHVESAIGALSEFPLVETEFQQVIVDALLLFRDLLDKHSGGC